MLGKVASELTVDAFIEQAREIVDKFKSSPVFAVKAQEEARDLLRRFEEYLEARNLKAVVTGSMEFEIEGA